uniref:Nanos 1 n=1 Tax=Nematostella vectensis TaxID=45351 RepID=Q5IGV2_NEMVE|nr:Nanos 1 [Nematostella vectensis]
MGDEMLSVFYHGDLYGGSGGKLSMGGVETFKDTLDDQDEFRLFRDYFGLIHLVQNRGVVEDEDSVVDQFFNFTYKRTRMDSIGSDRDSVTSSGSSAGSAEFEFKMEPHFGSKAVGSSLLPGTRSLTKRTDIDTAARNRKNRENKKNRNANVCVFCRNNGESKKVYSSHVLKDAEGNTTCPILRAYTCPLCKASGSQSHTIKYCPKNKNGSKLQAKV